MNQLTYLTNLGSHQVNTHIFTHILKISETERA